jgi:raffinose/stachyose/melibiose transport system substrate-binding protein|uniref:ABC transporter substrate-binding protein n=1 Tax=Cephaloticoccus sp. TaxID=1985742 RepID=UPI00404AE31F
MSPPRQTLWGVAGMISVYLAAVVWVLLHRTDSNDGLVTVRIAHWQVEVGPSRGFAAVIKRFEALNLGIRVEQLIVPPGVYRQWLRANLAGEIAPEIVEYGVWLDGLSDVPVKYFEPLTHYLEQPNPYNEGTPLESLPWLETFTDELSEQRLNSPEPGQYFAITLTRGSLRLFCNRDLLREITGSDHIPETMIEFRKLCEKVGAFGATRERPLMPLAGSGFNARFLLGIYLAGATSKLRTELDRDGLLSLTSWRVLSSYQDKKWDFQRPEMKSALQLLAELQEQMRPGYLQLGRDEAAREFLRGDALFIFSGTWDATSLRKEAQFPISVGRCPQLTIDDPIVGPNVLGRIADGNNVTGFGLSLTKSGKHRREAVLFMQFLASYEGNKIFSEVSGWPPSVNEVPMQPEIAELLSPDDGFNNGTGFLNAGGSTRALLERNLHLLAGFDGGVERLAAALDEQMPGAVRADLQATARDAWLSAVPQDARIAALSLLIAGAADADSLELRRERLEAAQNQSEARGMLIDMQLQASRTKDFK